MQDMEFWRSVIDAVASIATLCASTISLIAVCRVMREQPEDEHRSKSSE
jgi:hypothetical protein